jgi:hypothetical protein
LGLIVGAASTCLMYFAQLFFGLSSTKMAFNYEHPWVHATPKSTGLKRIGHCFQAATIIAALGSFILFVVGLWYCRAIILSARL